MSKQANQRYRRELGLDHKERAKDSAGGKATNKNSTSLKDMPSREGFGDGNPYGFSDRNSSGQNK